MSIQIICPKCAAQLKASERHAGRKLTCPKCASPIEVPAQVIDVKHENPEVSAEGSSCTTGETALVAAAKPEFDESGTNLRRFLAKRGILLMKEFRDIGNVKCEYGTKVAVSTVIIIVANSRNGDASHGIRLEQVGDDGSTCAASFLDFDESEEFLAALDFIDAAARKWSASNEITLSLPTPLKTTSSSVSTKTMGTNRRS